MIIFAVKLDIVIQALVEVEMFYHFHIGFIFQTQWLLLGSPTCLGALVRQGVFSWLQSTI